MITIKIIAGSTRPGRFNIQPANWITHIAKERKDIKVELVDLESLNLPVLDEPNPASRNQYTKEHTKKWSAIVDEADGFIFVTPEYNHSVPGSFKNAFDFLYHEWNFKPISFVSYGSAAGGARSVEHWRGIAGEAKMFDLREQLLLPNYWENMDEKGQYKFTDDQVQLANTILDNTIFWATKMKPAREELKNKAK